MKKRLQGLIAGMLISAMLTSGVVFAKNIQETIDAVYMNVKLVIDGEEITPKDANGNTVEPFIYNGTTYLPVRAIGEAFDKDVHWDGETATVYVGDIVKPAKEVYLYDKPYLECSNSKNYRTGKLDDELQNFIGMKLDYEEKNRIRYAKDYIVYPLNALAKQVRGQFVAPLGNWNGRTLQIKFYDENNRLLYTSPIMNEGTATIDFEFDVKNVLRLKVEFSAEFPGGWCDGYINNFAILTTDY